MTGIDREAAKTRRQEKIFRAAAKVLCNFGYDKASLRDIAQATNMTKAGLYYYFKSKEELLYKLLDGYMNELLKGIKEIDARVSDPHDFLRESIRFQVNMYCRDSIRSKLIIHDENCLSNPYFKKLKERQREYISYWREGLERLCEKEGIKIDHMSVYVNFLIGICNWIYQWYDAKKAVKPDDLADRIFDLFLYGLTCRNVLTLNQGSPEPL